MGTFQGRILDISQLQVIDVKDCCKKVEGLKATQLSQGDMKQSASAKSLLMQPSRPGMHCRHVHWAPHHVQPLSTQSNCAVRAVVYMVA